MATSYFTPLLGRRLRVTEMTEAGDVKAGPDGRYIVTDGFITFSMTPVVEDGVEILQRNASGGLCVNEREANEFKRFDIEIEFCGVNPALLAMVTNAEEYTGDIQDDIIGFKVAEGPINKYFAMELFTGLAGSAAAGYFLMPFLQAGTLGDVEINGENAVNFRLTGAYTKGGHNWGSGPYNVVADAEGAPAKLPTPLDSADHLLILETGVPAPVASHEPVANAEAP